MNIIEKIEQLPLEKQQQALLVVQKQGLDNFLAQVGEELTDEEKAAAHDYFETKKVELTDEEIETATGGLWFKKCPNGHFEASYSILGPTIGCWNCKDFMSHIFYCSYFDAHTVSDRIRDI